MELVIGGVGQGKLAYVLAMTKMTEKNVFFGETDSFERLEEETVLIVKDFHLLVKRWLKEGRDLLWETQHLLTLFGQKNKGIIISNEIGCGVVPYEAFDREYREQVGRMSCILAKEAVRVIRIVCGIGTVIKAW